MVSSHLLIPLSLILPIGPILLCILLITFQNSPTSKKFNMVRNKARERINYLWQHVIVNHEIEPYKEIDKENEVSQTDLNRFNISRILYNFENLDNPQTNRDQEAPFLFMPLPEETLEHNSVHFSNPEEQKNSFPKFREYNPPADPVEASYGFWEPSDCAMMALEYVDEWANFFPRTADSLQGFLPRLQNLQHVWLVNTYPFFFSRLSCYSILTWFSFPNPFLLWKGLTGWYPSTNECTMVLRTDL